MNYAIRQEPMHECPFGRHHVWIAPRPLRRRQIGSICISCLASQPRGMRWRPELVWLLQDPRFGRRGLVRRGMSHCWKDPQMLQLTGMEGEAGARHSETQRCHGGGDGDGDGDGEGDDDVMAVHNIQPSTFDPPSSDGEGRRDNYWLRVRSCLSATSPHALHLIGRSDLPCLAGALQIKTPTAPLLPLSFVRLHHHHHHNNNIARDFVSDLPAANNTLPQTNT